MQINQKMWDERAPLHAASAYYDLEGFVAGRTHQLMPFETSQLGDLNHRHTIHLQCHLGLDTIQIARHYPAAQITGLDFSSTAVAQATHLAQRTGVEDRVRFIVSNVYEAAEAVPHHYDVVYTGKGALNWLPDLDRWASTVKNLLRPGGSLYLVEFHPIGWVMGEDQPELVGDYFDNTERHSDVSGSYATAAKTTHNVRYEWHHPIDHVINAILGVGLRLRQFHEYDYTMWDQYPWLVTGDDGLRRWPSHARLPLMYSLKAVRPPN